MNIKSQVKEHILNLLEEQDIAYKNELADDTILFDTGLDSLGFAILVARLEEALGYDPFILMENAFYPRTFSEFYGVYEKFRNHAK